VLRDQNGNIYISGEDKKLLKYDKNARLVAQTALEDQSWSGMITKDKVICSLKNDLIVIYDFDLKNPKRIITKNPVEKFLANGDEILLAEKGGYV
jgi:hypothetical protein